MLRRLLGWLVFAVSCAGLAVAADDLAAVFERAQQLERDRKYAEAVDEYTKLVQAQPFEAAPYVYRGWARHLAGDEAGALADLGTADTFEPGNPNIVGRRGMVWKAVNDWESAATDFSAAGKLVPEDAAWRYQLAFCLARAGKPAEALAAADEAIRLNADAGEYWILRASIHEKLGHAEAGLADCERAAALVTGERAKAAIEAIRARLAALGHPADARPRRAGALLPEGRPAAAGTGARGGSASPAGVDVERDDTIEGDQVSMAAIHGAAPAGSGDPAPPAVRNSPPSAPPAPPAAQPRTPPQAASAPERRGGAAEPLPAPDPAAWQAIEGVWRGERIGTWTFQVLHDFGRGLALVESGDGGRGMLEALPQRDAWLFFQGDSDDTPDEIQLWRLEIVDGKLHTHAYEPHRSEIWHEVGRFKNYVSERLGPLQRRERYDPDEERDGDERAVDWPAIHRRRFEARAGEIAVLRQGGLDPEMELSRRREWAAAEAPDEVDDVIERMSLEQDKPRDQIDREKAQGRALLQQMNRQYYEYGPRPPAFDNCRDWFEAAPDLATRARRQAILVWNLRLRLDRGVTMEHHYLRRLHGMRPEQRAAGLANLRESIAEQKKRIGTLRADMAKQEPGSGPWQYTQSVIAEIEADIADSQDRMRCIEGEIVRRASLEAPSGYEDLPLATIFAEARRKVEAEMDLPACLAAIAAQLDRELPATAGKAPPPVLADVDTVPGDCRIELP